MREFQDLSPLEQIAHDRYLKYKPQQAMESLMTDVAQLSRMVEESKFSGFNTVAFEGLLSLVEAGLEGLLKLAFSPEERRFFTSTFRQSIAHTITSFPHSPSYPPDLYTRLSSIVAHCAHASPHSIEKPSLSVKKYIGGVAMAIAGVVGVSALASSRHESKKPEAPVAFDLPEKLEPQPIEVSLSDSATQSSPSLEPAVDSPYYASLLENTAKKDKENAEAKEKSIAGFKKYTQELLNEHHINYRRYFIDRDAIGGITLPHNVQSAEGNLQQVINTLRPQVQGLSPEKYLKVIAPYIRSPKGKKDSRNNRSYLTDLFNDMTLNSQGKIVSFKGNCEARASAYLVLTQELRPDLLSQVFGQVFKAHVRFGMKDGTKLFGVDGSVKTLKPFHLRGTALASPEEFFVEPYLTGKPYVPPETSRDAKYTRSESVHTDSALPGAVSDGLKTLDEESEEELVETQNVTPQQAESLVAEKHAQEAKEEGCNMSGMCRSFSSSQFSTEKAFIDAMEKDPDSVVNLTIDSLPLTPTLARAISSFHFLNKLTVHEKGLIPELPSPMVTVVEHDPLPDYIIRPNDLLADLIRKLNLQQLEFPSLKYASRPLMEAVALQKELRALRVPHALRPQFEKYVPSRIVSDEFLNLDYEVLTRVSEYQKIFQQHGVSTKGMPSKEKIMETLHKLPEQTVRSMLMLKSARLVIIPPVNIKKLIGNDTKFKILWPEGWSDVGSTQWRFGVTHGVTNAVFDETLYYKDAKNKTGPRTNGEMVQEYIRRYRRNGLEILPREAYLSLQLVALSSGTPFDTQMITAFAPIVGVDRLPSASWGRGRVDLGRRNPDASNVYLRSRPWVEGK